MERPTGSVPLETEHRANDIITHLLQKIQKRPTSTIYIIYARPLELGKPAISLYLRVLPSCTPRIDYLPSFYIYSSQ